MSLRFVCIRKQFFCSTSIYQQSYFSFQVSYHVRFSGVIRYNAQLDWAPQGRWRSIRSMKKASVFISSVHFFRAGIQLNGAHQFSVHWEAHHSFTLRLFRLLLGNQPHLWHTYVLMHLIRDIWLIPLTVLLFVYFSFPALDMFLTLIISHSLWRQEEDVSICLLITKERWKEK